MSPNGVRVGAAGSRQPTASPAASPLASPLASPSARGTARLGEIGSQAHQILLSGTDRKTQRLYLEFKYDRNEKVITVAGQRSLTGFARFKEMVPGGKTRRAKRAASSFRTALAQAREDISSPLLNTLENPSRRGVTADEFHRVNTTLMAVGEKMFNKQTKEAVTRLMPSTEDNPHWQRVTENLGLDPEDDGLQSYFATRFPEYFVAHAENPKAILELKDGTDHHKLPDDVGKSMETLAVKMLTNDRPVEDADRGIRQTKSYLKNYSEAIDITADLVRSLQEYEPEKVSDHLNNLAVVTEKMIRSGDPLYEKIDRNDTAARTERTISVLIGEVNDALPDGKIAPLATKLVLYARNLGQKISPPPPAEASAQQPKQAEGLLATAGNLVSWAYNGFWGLLGYQTESSKPSPTAAATPPGTADASPTKADKEKPLTAEQVAFQKTMLRLTVDNLALRPPRKAIFRGQINQHLSPGNV